MIILDHVTRTRKLHLCLHNPNLGRVIYYSSMVSQSYCGQEAGGMLVGIPWSDTVRTHESNSYVVVETTPLPRCWWCHSYGISVKICMQIINQPKQWMNIIGSKAGEADSSKPFETRHGTTVFCACSAGFQSCIGPEETHCVLYLLFGMVTTIC